MQIMSTFLSFGESQLALDCKHNHLLFILAKKRQWLAGPMKFYVYTLSSMFPSIDLANTDNKK